MAGMRLIAITLLLLPGICLGNQSITDPESMPNPNYVEEAPWEENVAKLPAYPKNENLLPFVVSSATSNKFMIDTASISVGNDKVVRYTVVIESPSGARTVNYEGLLCETMERKIYGFGQADGKWTENKRAAWEGIKRRSLLSYHKALFEDIFCDVGVPVWNAEEAVRNLKHPPEAY